MMAQADLLLPWLDVLGNVALGARLRGEAARSRPARAMIERVGPRPPCRQAPAPRSRAGERQRAALARTLMEDRP